MSSVQRLYRDNATNAHGAVDETDDTASRPNKFVVEQLKSQLLAVFIAQLAELAVEPLSVSALGVPSLDDSNSGHLCSTNELAALLTDGVIQQLEVR